MEKDTHAPKMLCDFLMGTQQEYRMAKTKIKFLWLLSQNYIYSWSMWKLLLETQMYKTWKLHLKKNSLSWLQFWRTMVVT